MTRAAGSRTRWVLWIVVTAFAGLGAFAGVGRSLHVGGFGALMEPARTQIFEATGRRDPVGTNRADAIAKMDRKFEDNRTLTQLHVLPGALFMLLAPLQLVAAIRSRRLGFHRWNGRLLITAGLVSVVPGLFFGLVNPLGGSLESVIIATVGALFVVALARAFAAIRRKDVATHREWMLRALAAGFGISGVRVVAGPLDFLLAPRGVPVEAIFVISLAVGWGVTLAVAEWWIRTTRPRRAIRELPA